MQKTNKGVLARAKNPGRLLYILSIIVLVLYPLRHVHLGVDLWDGGYNYANFCYNSLEYMDSMWYFATWSANAVGSLLMHLPLGSTVLGMNIYTGLLVGAIGAGAYVFCTGKLKIPAWAAFTGELLALSLCWVPTAVLYNYLTYALFMLGCILLYQGLVKDETKYLILAGVALGLNVSVRFSNLVQMGLILAVWYYGIVCKKKFVKILQETGFCALGYVGALAVFLLFIAVKYDVKDYFDSVLRLFAMTEQAVDYTPGSMLTAMLEGLTDNDVTYWEKRLALALVLSAGVCASLPGRLVPWKKGLTLGIHISIIGWMIKHSYCNANYTTYQAIHYPMYMMLLMIMLVSVGCLFDKGFSKEEKLRCGLLPLIIYLSSLGGNNAIYASVNNLFWVLPCFFWLMWKLIREKKHILYFPVKTMLVLSMALMLYQGMRFGQAFVYEEAAGNMETTAESREIPRLQSMHTKEAKISQLNGLYRYIQENQLGNRECILYGNIPGVSFYMQLPPALNIWSDLRSYGVDSMRADIQKVEEEILAGAQKPLVILERAYGDYLATGMTELCFDHESTNEKFMLLKTFMELHQYKQAYINEKYVVYQ